MSSSSEVDRMGSTEQQQYYAQPSTYPKAIVAAAPAVPDASSDDVEERIAKGDEEDKPERVTTLLPPLSLSSIPPHPSLAFSATATEAEARRTDQSKPMPERGKCSDESEKFEKRRNAFAVPRFFSATFRWISKRGKGSEADGLLISRLLDSGSLISVSS